MADQPIGIFDSGVGGLTVANAICKLLPHENTVYFGDTTHLPYGDKSSEAVKAFSLRIADFLIEKNCKMIVIACNTASAAAYNALNLHIQNKALLINVIDPMVNYLEQTHAQQRIGIIATKGTIGSKVYERKLHERHISEVKSLATPLLVHLIEEGFSGHPGCQLLVNEYLSNPALNEIEVLVLACTHYPIIKNLIEEYYEGRTSVLDSTIITAKATQAALANAQLLNNSSTPGLHQFYVSDYTPAFETIAHLFYGDKIKLEQSKIWKSE
jgi:glutamate racemase